MLSILTLVFDLERHRHILFEKYKIGKRFNNDDLVFGAQFCQMACRLEY